MIKKVFVFCPNKVDVHTVGVNGVTGIQVIGNDIYISFDSGNEKVYISMSCVYDWEKGKEVS
jgi:hypothetical protein